MNEDYVRLKTKVEHLEENAMLSNDLCNSDLSVTVQTKVNLEREYTNLKTQLDFLEDEHTKESNELATEKMILEDRTNFLHAITEQLSSKTNMVGELLTQIQRAKLNEGQEKSALKSSEDYGRTLDNKNRLNQIEQNKCQMDKTFILSQNNNVQWQIDTGLQSRINAKQQELDEVEKQMVSVTVSLDEQR